MRRSLLVVIALLVLAALGWLAYGRSGRPRPLARARGDIVAPPVGRPGLVAWLETGPDGDRLMLAPRWQSPRPLYSGKRLMGLALVDSKALVTQRGEGAEGRLLAVDVTTGEAQQLAPVKGDANQVVAGEGVICWLEERAAALPGVPFVAAAAPVSVIRSVPETAGPSSVVSALAMDTVPAGGKRGSQGLAELLGVAGGKVYWMERRGSGAEQTTRLRRCGATGGEPELLVTEKGSQDALLLSHALVWTAPSQEAAVPAQYLAVRRRPLGAGGAETIGDWVAPGAALLGAGRAAYAQERDILWRFGASREDQRALYPYAGAMKTARAIGDEEYLVLRRGKALAVAKRPLTWWARLRALLGG